MLAQARCRAGGRAPAPPHALRALQSLNKHAPKKQRSERPSTQNARISLSDFFWQVFRSARGPAAQTILEVKSWRTCKPQSRTQKPKLGGGGGGILNRHVVEVLAILRILEYTPPFTAGSRHSGGLAEALGHNRLHLLSPILISRHSAMHCSPPLAPVQDKHFASLDPRQRDIQK